MRRILQWWRSRPVDTFVYAPRQNGRPDVGEVCWAWVPFEEDPSQGKDRPVLIVGRRGRRYLALMLTSKDRVASKSAGSDRHGRVWLDIGTGAWDRLQRPSEVRIDRLLELTSVRREGAAIDRATYDRVVALGRQHWH